MSERTLRRNMDRIWLYAIEPPLDASRSGQCQPDFRIARHRQCAELIGAQEFHVDTHSVRLARDVPQCAYDAIDLRVPGVSDDQNFHAIKPLLPAAARRPRARYHDLCASR